MKIRTTNDNVLLRKHLPEWVERSSNVLLSCSSPHPTDADCCTNLLTVEDPDRVHVVHLSTTPLWFWTRSWDAYVNEPPGALTVVPAEDAAGTVDGSLAESVLSEADTVVEPAADAGDLSRLGLRVSEHLERRDDLRPVVCLHSVGDLLAGADSKRAFRFLHLLTKRTTAAGALAHYHLDPDTVDLSAIAALSQLFDAVVEVSDGEITVRTE